VNILEDKIFNIKKLEIRREAYRRIIEALMAKGIHYAHRKVIVEMPQDTGMAKADQKKYVEAGAAAGLAAIYHLPAYYQQRLVNYGYTRAYDRNRHSVRYSRHCYYFTGVRFTPSDVVELLVMASLPFTGILKPGELTAGLGSTAVVVLI
jgi:hypothetical protein